MSEKETELDRIITLLMDYPKGLTIDEVSRLLTISRATAAKYLNGMVVSGQAELRELGRAKLFYLTQRLPLTNLLSLASDLILILDNELFIQEMNDPFLEIFDLTRADLKGFRIEHTLLASYFSDGHMKAFKEALDGLTSSFELNVPIQEEQRYFRMKVIPLIFEKGDHGVGILLEDITPMKKYQQELEEEVRLRTEALVKSNDALQREMLEHKEARITLARNEARLRKAEEVAEFGNVEIYIETGTAILSRGAQVLLGIPQTESTLSHIVSLVLDEYRPTVDGALQKLRAESAPIHQNFRIRRPNDQEIITLQSIAEFDRKQNTIFIVIHDISERMRAEDAVRRATKQIVLLNSVTRHDILNQLNALALHIAYRKKKTEDATVLEQLEKEKQITETIRHQIVFTRDYQNIGLEPPQWTNVAKMISKVLATKERHGIRIAINTGNLEVFSDLLIEKVYFNLVDNAIRHGERVTQINFGYQMSEQGLILFCEDDGVGVPEEDKTKIFERAFGSNTGYGLFLVREILSITGFTIRECGVYGKGARFEILIPNGSYRFAS